jgi:hypothetical protein
MKKTLLSWGLGIGGVLIAAFIGLWSKSLFTISESVHFSVNFPAATEGNSGALMDCCDLGSPWERAFGSKWKDYPPGGVLVWGTEGQVLLDMGQIGWLKRIFQPHFLNLSSHWIRNVGVKPYKIRLDMDLCGYEMEWETPEANWDQATQSTTRFIEPGKTFNMDWYVHIPPTDFVQNAVCLGELKVSDAETGELLSALPITILNTKPLYK